MAFVGLGSNLGDREANLARAAELLGQEGLRVRLRSSIYRADPVEVIDQDEFLNQVVGCETGLAPERILATCLKIEKTMGRVRTRMRGPRVIDIDLLLLGETVRVGDGLELPHPRMHLRRFVLVPLVEIAPQARHPGLGLTAAQMLERCPDRSRVERLVM
ncbi:MAG TPA: 2-amino-4-hydroxy-6-hydroxymethyldihydropteridine diphosphokinase [Candidatus Polarisedimenticolia bacterium]|nr:2-amino-4-hydroxy-6-hydroxymethyldihydropteridine diphosphokinase [Candidatus Polarisedimenticolia bacterium]